MFLQKHCQSEVESILPMICYQGSRELSFQNHDKLVFIEFKETFYSLWRKFMQIVQLKTLKLLNGIHQLPLGKLRERFQI